ncbi:MAG: hypothetical protein RIF33_00325 [Cyclobacteriaceae bacterium]
MEKEIVILSDLWGTSHSHWIRHFRKGISSQYNIKFYDSCELGNIDVANLDEKIRHEQFINFGIQNAVNKLIELEKESKIYIGCSVGGVIAWKAGLAGLRIQELVTISSTRLRKETDKPNCPVRMYFGEFDKYKPDRDWLITINCTCEIIEGGNHDIYNDELVVSEILEKLNLGWKDQK